MPQYIVPSPVLSGSLFKTIDGYTTLLIVVVVRLSTSVLSASSSFQTLSPTVTVEVRNSVGIRIVRLSKLVRFTPSVSTTNVWLGSSYLVKIEYKSEVVCDSASAIFPASRSSGSNPKSSAASACPLIPPVIVSPLLLFNASYTIAIEPNAFGNAGSPASIFLLLHLILLALAPPISSTVKVSELSPDLIGSAVTTTPTPNAFAK